MGDQNLSPMSASSASAPSAFGAASTRALEVTSASAPSTSAIPSLCEAIAMPTRREAIGIFAALCTLPFALSAAPLSFPEKAFAQTEDGDTVLAFISDVHNGDAALTDPESAATRMKTWLAGVEAEVGPIDRVGLCGDLGSISLFDDEFWSCVGTVYGILDDAGIKYVSTTGNHEFFNGRYGETPNPVAERYIVDTPAVEKDNYRMYCMGTIDGYVCSYPDSQIDALEAYLAGIDDAKPTFILSHYPLHAYIGGGHDRDTGNAQRLIDALNKASDRGCELVFLWGHNHTLADSHYDKIIYPGQSLLLTKEGKTAEIRFTYASAGCMSDAEYLPTCAGVLGKGLVIIVSPEGVIESMTYYDKKLRPVTPTAEPVVGGKYIVVAFDGYALTSKQGKAYTLTDSSNTATNLYKGPSGVEFTPGMKITPEMIWKIEDAGDGFIYLRSFNGGYLNAVVTDNNSGGYDGMLTVGKNRSRWRIVESCLYCEDVDKYLVHGGVFGAGVNSFSVRGALNACSFHFYAVDPDIVPALPGT